MKQPAAPISQLIKILTGVYFALCAGTVVLAWYIPLLWWVPVLLLAIAVYCYYCWAAVAYELESDTLTVFFRVGKKQFAPVVRCAAVQQSPGFGIRLMGNGGVFAGSGLFWSRHYGVFWAYVTRHRHTDWVRVETPRRKVIISPVDPAAFGGGE